MGSASSAPFDYEKQLLSDTKAQSQEIKDGKSEAATVPRCSNLPNYPIEKGLLDGVELPESKGRTKLTTIWEVFQAGVAKAGTKKMFGTRPYKFDEKTKQNEADKEGPIRGEYIWESYDQIHADVLAIASGLVSLGMKKADNLGILSINRTEWIKCSLAGYSQGFRTVSLYATLGETAVEFICTHAEIRVLCIEKDGMKAITKSLPKLGKAAGGVLEYIIQFDVNPLYTNGADAVSEADRKACATHGVTLLGLSEIMGKAAVEPNAPTGDDLAMIMYTSGTTGQPKGVMLSHQNICAAVGGMPYIWAFGTEERYVSYLPLAHIFETVVQVALWNSGSACAFFQGNVKKLTADFESVRPTILAGVPRVFSRIYDRVMSQIETKSCMVKHYVKKALAFQSNAVRTGTPRNATYDTKVFVPMRTKMGLDGCKMVLTGAAPCAPFLMEFLKVVTGAVVLQGYGMTETSATISVTLPNDRNTGHCGPPLPSVQVKLADVPDMNYLSTDKPHPRGEIMVRGPVVFQGYFKNDKDTKETLEADGWMHTGDVGRWNPNGTITIIDRKKNLFKLAQGEYIATELIESTYAKCPLVSQIWVYGNSFKNSVLAVVVPEADKVSTIAVEKGWAGARPALGTDEFSTYFAALCSGPHAADVKKVVVDGMKAVSGPLKGFEKVIDIVVEGRIDRMLAGFTEQNDCMTPTFKLRRPYLLKRYIDQLKDTYAKNGEPNKPDEIWPGTA